MPLPAGYARPGADWPQLKDRLKSSGRQHPEIIKVFGEAFCKKLQGASPFQMKGDPQKLLSFLSKGLL
ncbi:hypothetical protein [Novacetimonas pomaceti]|uniref:hypothetical protein n=1 Tax=Novacetimonas pomaceti TaxID=2021998 RepID=UPI00105768C9|nr:hypothetical protein [Novacetimonas pomaceti]